MWILQRENGRRNGRVSPETMSNSTHARAFGSVALMFPGQGSQYPGMGVDLAAESSVARQILERADDGLGYALSKIMAGDRGDELHHTVHTQPAIFVHSMALFELLRERFPLDALIAAGHSLGEYSALCATGVLDFDEALDIVRIRAAGMDRAQPRGTCAMAAIMGLSSERVRELVDIHRQGAVLEAANFNAPDQVVVSGSVDAVNRMVQATANERRAKAVMLPVSSAFHTSLMEPARTALMERLAHVSFGKAQFPVVANVTAQPYPSGEEEIRRVLVDQVISPVQWQESVKTMKGLGAREFVEIGPGKVLSGLLRRIDRQLTSTTISDLESIRSLERAWA